MIVLDTHAWVWWVADPDRIAEPARRAIDETVASGESVRVSSISAWEVAMLVDRGRLELAMPVADWVGLAEAAPEITFVPVGNRIARGSVHLTEWAHRDPADRIIVATALALRATLVTADSRLRSYPAVETLWD